MALAALAVACRAEADGGRLAYIGGDGNVYVTTADLATTVAVTDDATVPVEGSGLSYHRVAWSPDGRLAYAAVVRDNNDATSKLYVKSSPDAPPVVVGESDEHFVIYVNWSPVPCPERPDCRQLAYLIEESRDIGLRLVEIRADGSVSNRLIGLGWPYYFAWAPDGRSLLGHIGGLATANPDAHLAHYTLADGRTRTLPVAPGNFQSPAWLPETGWLAVTAAPDAAGAHRLSAPAAESPTADIVGVNEEQVSFAVSPDGRTVAFAVRARPRDPFLGPIHLYDRVTGEVRRLTDVGLRQRAFFWDPAGERLAYLTWLPVNNQDWLQWRVIDIASGADRGFQPFFPTLQMNFVVSSFSQYAQSHRFWSPDGRYLVYGDRVGDRDTRLWLLDTLAEGADPIFVDAGVIGFWSWEP